MKRNLEVAYKFLCEIEALDYGVPLNLKVTTDGSMTDEDVERSAEVIRLYEGGFIKATFSDGWPTLVTVSGLSWTGCDLLDRMRNEHPEWGCS